MAEEKQDNEGGAPDGGEPKSKKKLFVGGGVTVGLALAFLAALMGVPKKDVDKSLDGPFVAPLTSSKIQVNLSDSKSFLILDLNVVYEAYEEAYFVARQEDPLGIAEIKDALVGLASSKSRQDVSDPVNKPVLMEEIRAAVEPLIFPLHIGDAAKPTAPDGASGVAPGRSSHLGTFRGEYEQHVLQVDAPHKTVQLDDGPVMSFEGTETDLELQTAGGLVLYLDVTALQPEFTGDVRAGVMGRVRRILWNEVLIQ
jgi:flagellar basal body-associated protein FliL